MSNRLGNAKLAVPSRDRVWSTEHHIWLSPSILLIDLCSSTAHTATVREILRASFTARYSFV
jgi:hypothetical protein